MQILLASAKIMRERCVSRGLVPDIPHFQTQAEVLAADMRCKSSEEISRLLSCSPEIAELNRRRYALFGTDEAEEQWHATSSREGCHPRMGLQNSLMKASERMPEPTGLIVAIEYKAPGAFLCVCLPCFPQETEKQDLFERDD